MIATWFARNVKRKVNLGRQVMILTHNLNFVKTSVAQVITPDPWKAGASNTTKPGGRKVGENKLLTASKNRFNPMTTEFKKCKICKVSFQCIYDRSWMLRLFFISLNSTMHFSKKCTRWGPIIAKPAPTRRGSARCAASRCWTLRATGRLPPDAGGWRWRGYRVTWSKCEVNNVDMLLI